MAIQTLKTIKNWFRTGLKPTQSQFWDTWDSFRHKNEKIPVGDIEGGSQNLDQVLTNGSTASDKEIELNSTFNESYASFSTHGIQFSADGKGGNFGIQSFGFYDDARGGSIRVYPPRGMGDNINFAFPDMPIHPNNWPYILATKDDITLSSVMETSSMWYHYEDGYPSKWFSVDGGFSIGGFSAGTNSASIGITPEAGFNFQYTDSGTSSTITFRSFPLDHNDGINRNLLFSLPTNKASGTYTLATTEDLNTPIPVKGEYKNNTSALAGGLVHGDLYNLPMDTDNAVVCIVIQPKVYDFWLEFLSFPPSITDINDPLQWTDWMTSKGSIIYTPFTNVIIEGNRVNFEGLFSNIYSLRLESSNITAYHLNNISNLSILYLSRNKLTKISLIEGSSVINILDFYDNQISVIENINHFKFLADLRLGRNQISAIENLEGLDNLAFLALDSNQISTIENLETRTALMTLRLENNQISKIQNLENLTNLTFLSIAQNQISKIENLESQTNLTFLLLDQNQIPKIENLELLTSLTYLSLGVNLITKIENLNALVNLSMLGISENQISKIENIDSLINLKGVFLSNNLLTKIENLETLNLEIFQLDGNRVNVIENLETQVNLKVLAINYNGVTSLSGIETLVNLETLTIAANGISSLAELQYLPKLQSLVLASNPNITELPSFAENPLLQELLASYCQISILNNIDSLVNLSYIQMEGNLLITSEFDKWNSWASLAPNNGTMYISANSENLSTGNTI